MLFRRRCAHRPADEASPHGCTCWFPDLDRGAAYGYSCALYPYTVAADVYICPTDAYTHPANADAQTNQHTDRHTDANSCLADGYGYP